MDEAIVERSLAPYEGRFGRFNVKLGEGAAKVVYEAVDLNHGKLVAWNEVSTSHMTPRQRRQVEEEVELLRSLRHPNIIDFYGSWATPDRVIFITEVVESGDLQRFYRLHRVKLKVVKKWCRQILSALLYLHSHDPPIVHRDVKCENILYNAADGTVKIGDLGLSSFSEEKNGGNGTVSATTTTTTDDNTSTSAFHPPPPPGSSSGRQTGVSAGGGGAVILGTPNYMAPEQYEGICTDAVDIYAFGMCVLEIVTGRVPYDECHNAAQIYKRVITGVPPQCFQSVKHQTVRQFISKCIEAPASMRSGMGCSIMFGAIAAAAGTTGGNVGEADERERICRRPTAEELLADPFLDESVHTTEDDDDELVWTATSVTVAGSGPSVKGHQQQQQHPTFLTASSSSSTTTSDGAAGEEDERGTVKSHSPRTNSEFSVSAHKPSDEASLSAAAKHEEQDENGLSSSSSVDNDDDDTDFDDEVRHAPTTTSPEKTQSTHRQQESFNSEQQQGNDNESRLFLVQNQNDDDEDDIDDDTIDQNDTNGGLFGWETVGTVALQSAGGVGSLPSSSSATSPSPLQDALLQQQQQQDQQQQNQYHDQSSYLPQEGGGGGGGGGGGAVRRISNSGGNGSMGDDEIGSAEFLSPTMTTAATPIYAVNTSVSGSGPSSYASAESVLFAEAVPLGSSLTSGILIDGSSSATDVATVLGQLNRRNSGSSSIRSAGINEEGQVVDAATILDSLLLTTSGGINIGGGSNANNNDNNNDNNNESHNGAELGFRAGVSMEFYDANEGGLLLQGAKIGGVSVGTNGSDDGTIVGIGGRGRSTSSIGIQSLAALETGSSSSSAGSASFAAANALNTVMGLADYAEDDNNPFRRGSIEQRLLGTYGNSGASDGSRSGSGVLMYGSDREEGDARSGVAEEEEEERGQDRMQGSSSSSSPDGNVGINNDHNDEEVPVFLAGGLSSGSSGAILEALVEARLQGVEDLDGTSGGGSGTDLYSSNNHISIRNTNNKDDDRGNGEKSHHHHHHHHHPLRAHALRNDSFSSVGDLIGTGSGRASISEDGDVGRADSAQHQMMDGEGTPLADGEEPRTPRAFSDSLGGTFGTSSATNGIGGGGGNGAANTRTVTADRSPLFGSYYEGGLGDTLGSGGPRGSSGTIGLIMRSTSTPTHMRSASIEEGDLVDAETRLGDDATVVTTHSTSVHTNHVSDLEDDDIPYRRGSARSGDDEDDDAGGGRSGAGSSARSVATDDAQSYEEPTTPRRVKSILLSESAPQTRNITPSNSSDAISDMNDDDLNLKVRRMHSADGEQLVVRAPTVVVDEDNASTITPGIDTTSITTGGSGSDGGSTSTNYHHHHHHHHHQSSGSIENMMDNAGRHLRGIPGLNTSTSAILPGEGEDEGAAAAAAARREQYLSGNGFGSQTAISNTEERVPGTSKENSHEIDGSGSVPSFSFMSPPPSVFHGNAGSTGEGKVGGATQTVVKAGHNHADESGDGDGNSNRRHHHIHIDGLPSGLLLSPEPTSAMGNNSSRDVGSSTSSVVVPIPSNGYGGSGGGWPPALEDGANNSNRNETEPSLSPSSAHVGTPIPLLAPAPALSATTMPTTPSLPLLPPRSTPSTPRFLPSTPYQSSITSNNVVRKKVSSNSNNSNAAATTSTAGENKALSAPPSPPSPSSTGNVNDGGVVVLSPPSGGGGGGQQENGPIRLELVLEQEGVNEDGQTVVNRASIKFDFDKSRIDLDGSVSNADRRNASFFSEKKSGIDHHQGDENHNDGDDGDDDGGGALMSSVAAILTARELVSYLSSVPSLRNVNDSLVFFLASLLDTQRFLFRVSISASLDGFRVMLHPASSSLTSASSSSASLSRSNSSSLSGTSPPPSSSSSSSSGAEAIGSARMTTPTSPRSPASAATPIAAIDTEIPHPLAISSGAVVITPEASLDVASSSSGVGSDDAGSDGKTSYARLEEGREEQGRGLVSASASANSISSLQQGTSIAENADINDDVLVLAATSSGT